MGKKKNERAMFDQMASKKMVSRLRRGTANIPRSQCRKR